MNATILIVDDMRLNIDMLSEILGDDYTIMAAISGENAIKLLHRRKPDLVLLDVSMPGIGGFGVLEYIKGHREFTSIPVMFVTGETESYIEEQGLAMGAVDYIKKPYNASVVRAKVWNQLELKMYRDDMERLVQERTKQLEASREAIIMGMSLMSESHDNVTGEHIERIKKCTEILIRKMRELYPDLISEALANRIVLFSPLHDVGKVGITDAILKKTGALTREEFETMKSHTTNGAELLRKTEGFLVDTSGGNDLLTAIEIAECHHEKFDGTGYPHGLSGEEIPIAPRVVTLADIYDALRSARPYKKAFTHEEAVDILLEGDGRTCPEHFDPRVLETFRTVHNEIAKLYDGASD